MILKSNSAAHRRVFQAIFLLNTMTPVHSRGKGRIILPLHVLLTAVEYVLCSCHECMIFFIFFVNQDRSRQLNMRMWCHGLDLHGCHVKKFYI